MTFAIRDGELCLQHLKQPDDFLSPIGTRKIVVSMVVNSDLIDIWRKSPSEHQRIEFKEAKQGFDFKKSCKYCVAIANEGRGFLVFGIADKPPRPVVGTSISLDPVHHAQNLYDALNFELK